jgi:hypothetical protein
MKLGFLCALAALGFNCGCAGHMGGTAQNNFNILTGGPVLGTTVNDLPAPVRDTLRQQLPKAEIADIDKQEIDGHACYKISFSHPGTNGSITISQDGNVLQPGEIRPAKAE